MSTPPPAPEEMFCAGLLHLKNLLFPNPMALSSWIQGRPLMTALVTSRLQSRLIQALCLHRSWRSQSPCAAAGSTNCSFAAVTFSIGQSLSPGCRDVSFNDSAPAGRAGAGGSHYSTISICSRRPPGLKVGAEDMGSCLLHCFCTQTLPSTWAARIRSAPGYGNKAFF